MADDVQKLADTIIAGLAELRADALGDPVTVQAYDRCEMIVRETTGLPMVARVGGEPAQETDHLVRCPRCGGWLDPRDFDAALAHQGPLPHPTRSE